MAVLPILQILTVVLGQTVSESMAMADPLLRLACVLTSDDGSKWSGWSTCPIPYTIGSGHLAGCAVMILQGVHGA